MTSLGTKVCTDVSRAAIGSDVTLSVTLIPDEAFFARPWNSSTRIGSDVTLSVTQIPNTGSVQRTQASRHPVTATCCDGGFANRTPIARPAVNAWRIPARSARTTNPVLFASI